MTHVNPAGETHMVDVSEKTATRREARATARVRMKPETLDLIRGNAAKKGDVLGVARVAGIQAAKRTWELIPLCHQIPLSSVEVKFELVDAPAAVEIQTRAITDAKTGVEMEALTAAAVTALTIYDMCKAVDRGMVIESVGLLFKSGGASGEYRRPTPSRSHAP